MELGARYGQARSLAARHAGAERCKWRAGLHGVRRSTSQGADDPEPTPRARGIWPCARQGTPSTGGVTAVWDDAVQSDRA